MKKLIFTLAIILGAATVSAQEAGQMWVGGSVGFWSSKVKGADSQTSYKILPEFGYILSENLAVGISVGYMHLEGSQLNKSALAEEVDGENEGFTVNPFVRYSFLKGSIGSMFVDGGVGYTHMKEKNTKVKTNEFEVGFKPGVAVNVTSNLTLTGKFGFLGYKNEKEDDVKTNSFGLDFDMSQFLFGVSYVF